VGEELLDSRAVGEVGKIFGAADDFFKSAEEEHFDAHGLRSAWHKGIVTRARAGGQWHRLRRPQKHTLTLCRRIHSDGEFRDFS
jgi:hypothetical protein